MNTLEIDDSISMFTARSSLAHGVIEFKVITDRCNLKNIPFALSCLLTICLTCPRSDYLGPRHSEPQL